MKQFEASRVRHALTVTATVALPLLLGGCQAALWGNMIALGLTVGIFFGTLSLGRTAEASRSSAEASSSVLPRR